MTTEERIKAAASEIADGWLDHIATANRINAPVTFVLCGILNHHFGESAPEQKEGLHCSESSCSGAVKMTMLGTLCESHYANRRDRGKTFVTEPVAPSVDTNADEPDVTKLAARLRDRADEIADRSPAQESFRNAMAEIADAGTSHMTIAEAESKGLGRNGRFDADASPQEPTCGHPKCGHEKWRHGISRAVERDGGALVCADCSKIGDSAQYIHAFVPSVESSVLPSKSESE